jgi:hypothetical protein
VSIRLFLGRWGSGGVFQAQACASAALQYTATGCMSLVNLTNVSAAYVDLPLNNGTAHRRLSSAAHRALLSLF